MREGKLNPSPSTYYKFMKEGEGLRLGYKGLKTKGSRTWVRNSTKLTFIAHLQQGCPLHIEATVVSKALELAC